MFDLSFENVQREEVKACVTKKYLIFLGAIYGIISAVTSLSYKQRIIRQETSKFVRRVRRHFGIFSALLRVFN